MCDIEWNPKLFQIPDYLFDAEGIGVTPSEKPECPVIVFVNSKSGGQLGSALLTTYRSILNKNQVFDLHEVAPDKVLGKFYQNLERLKPIDTFSSIIEERLRLIVAGGDGTAGWLLGVISDLKLLNPPPIATSPLGTGNNLPFSFGWGKRNPGTDELSVKAFLRQVQKAKKMSTDSWHIVMKMKYSSGPPTLGSLPHSLHPFRHTSPSNTPDMDRYLAFRGGFWNYFSMGADAQVSHAFHSARKDHPEKFKNQLHNQGTYAKIGLKHGLFNASKFQSSSQNIAEIVKVSIMKKQGSWENLPVPQSIRSIICLNLPSFSGGLNPWGTPRASNKKWTPSFVDDGLLEIVGFKDIWQGLSLLAPQGHGTRLAQAHGIKFEFHKGADHTYMRLDGEPWEQPFPDDVVIEISHHGQVNILATDNCRSVGKDSLKQPIDHESNSSSHHTLEDDSDDPEENSEERRKFGAAETFKMLENIDISHLS